MLNRIRWQGSLWSAFGGALVVPLLTYLILSLRVGIEELADKRSIGDGWSVFWFFFSSRVSYFSYEEFLAIVLGGIAGAWGYNSLHLSRSAQTLFFFYIPLATLLFSVRKMIVVARIPHDFANQPDVVQQLLALNVRALILQMLVFPIILFLTYRVFRRYSKSIDVYLEGRSHEKTVWR